MHIISNTVLLPWKFHSIILHSSNLLFVLYVQGPKPITVYATPKQSNLSTLGFLPRYSVSVPSKSLLLCSIYVLYILNLILNVHFIFIFHLPLAPLMPSMNATSSGKLSVSQRKPPGLGIFCDRLPIHWSHQIVTELSIYLCINVGKGTITNSFMAVALQNLMAWSSSMSIIISGKGLKNISYLINYPYNTKFSTVVLGTGDSGYPSLLQKTRITAKGRV